MTAAKRILIAAALLPALLAPQSACARPENRQPTTKPAIDPADFQATELSRRAENFLKAGDAAQALPLLVEALRLRRAVMGERNPATLNSLNSYAEALQAIGRGAEAEPLAAEALRLRREVLGSRHPDTLQSLNSYVIVLDGLGRGAKAEPLAAESHRLSRKVFGANDPKTLRSLNTYAEVLYSLGRMTEAEPLLSDVLRLRRKILGYRHQDTLESLGNYATIIDELGRSVEAEPLYAETLRVSRELFGERDFRTIVDMNNYGYILLILGRYSDAEAIYAKALPLSRDVMGERHPFALRVASNYANILAKLGRRRDAEPLLLENIRITRQVLGDEHPDTSTSLNNYAVLLLELGRTAEAEPILAQALLLSRKTLGDRHPETLKGLTSYSNVLLKLGREAEALGLSRELVQSARSRAVELAQDGLRGNEQSAREFNARQARERSLADVMWANFTRDRINQPGLQSEAFIALQFSGGGTTTRAVADAAASRFAATAGMRELVEERRKLTLEWTTVEAAQVRAQAGEANEDINRESLRKRLTEIEARVGEIDAQLKVEAPQYFAIQNQQSVELDRLRSLLGEDEAVLFLVPTERGSHSMVITRDTILWERAAANKDAISDAVQKLRKGLEIVPGEYLPRFDLQQAYTLYSDLVAPVEDALTGKRRVFVVADGALSRLPLGTLVTRAPPPGASFDDSTVLRSAAWLADRYALVQLPSLQSLVYIRSFGSREEGRDDTSFLGFGAPALDGHAATRGARSPTLAPIEASRLVGILRGTSDAPLMDPKALRQLDALPGTRIELQRVQQALGASTDRLFLGTRMTETAIRSQDLSRTGILHLATHAFTSEEAGSLAEPGLVFTPPEVAKPADDGYLAASEVVGINLTSAKWVILSACNTASPSGRPGETGLSGLAQAFFYAGAESLLVSHWPVFDDIAPVITVETLKASRAGMPRAEALQAAMKRVRVDPSLDAAHPAVWAPFSLVGEGR